MAYAPAPSVATEAVIADARRRQRRRRLAIGALLAAALLALLLLQPWNGSPPTGSGGRAARQAASHPTKRRTASPVPGVFYDETGKPFAVCVGRGRWIARTPTRQDLKRFSRQFEKTHTLPPLPATLSIHVLPNGKVAGTCNYGSGPHTLADNL